MEDGSDWLHQVLVVREEEVMAHFSPAFVQVDFGQLIHHSGFVIGSVATASV
jgi:hypothetical protein